MNNRVSSIDTWYSIINSDTGKHCSVTFIWMHFRISFTGLYEWFQTIVYHVNIWRQMVKYQIEVFSKLLSLWHVISILLQLSDNITALFCLSPHWWWCCPTIKRSHSKCQLKSPQFFFPLLSSEGYRQCDLFTLLLLNFSV